MRSSMVVAWCLGLVACLPVSTMRLRADPNAPPEPALSRTTGVDLTAVVSVGEAARRRLAGQCYVPCAQGSTCNEDTGLCERIPCGICPEGDECVGTGTRARCVAATSIPTGPFVVTSKPSP